MKYSYYLINQAINLFVASCAKPPYACHISKGGLFPAQSPQLWSPTLTRFSNDSLNDSSLKAEDSEHTTTQEEVALGLSSNQMLVCLIWEGQGVGPTQPTR